jgi:DNA-binding transcriptional MerR regulator
MDDKLLRSGELARMAGVSSDLLRHYERIGIVQPPHRAANGYRQYPLKTLKRVQVVRRSLSLGFTLPELARIFAVRDRGGAPCQNVRALAEEKLRQIEQSLVELKALRRQLEATLADWDSRLQKTAPGQRANLLDALAGNHSGGKRRTRKIGKGFSKT